jgi:hypothetical protein
MGAPGGYEWGMTEPALVFASEREGKPEIVVNFGVFSGRDATEAEVYRLAQSLLAEVDSVEIICEQRYEFDEDVEATVYQVRVELPGAEEDRVGHFASLVEGWAADCISERRVITP